jgi:hypothetical protein
MPAVGKMRDLELIQHQLNPGFAFCAVLLTGISGRYMLGRLAAWERFESPSFWWLHLMVAL